MRGAACNGINQAGESPVAAIVRFGCVAMSDVIGERSPTTKAQTKVLGADLAIGPTRQEGEQSLGPQRERTLEASTRLSTRNGWTWLNEQSSLSRTDEDQWIRVKATDTCSLDLLRRIGGGTKRMDDVPKQGRSPRREASNTSQPARSEVTVRLTDRVVVAMTLRDNTTPAEQRTRGAAACSTKRGRTRHARHSAGTTGDPRRVAEASTKGASNSATRQGASDSNMRSRCLEAVLGKTRRTEFQKGPEETELRPMLNGHEAGNGGDSQARAYEPPRPGSTHQIRTYGLMRGCWPVRFARRAGVYSTTTPSAATGALRAPRGVRPVLTFRTSSTRLALPGVRPDPPRAAWSRLTLW